MAQKTKEKVNIDPAKMSDKEKRDLILSLRRIGGGKSSQKLPAPTTDDELHLWIEKELGYDIPRVAVCDDHTAPFDYVADFIFERYKSILVLGGRESAKTLNTSIIHYVNSEIKPGCESCTFANIEQQSNKAYTYVKSFLYTIDDSGKKVLKSSIEGDPLRKETKWKSGSKIEIIVGTVSGVNSPHPQKVHADEVDLIDDSIWDESRNMASSKVLPDGREIKAQNIGTSTLKSTKGIMQRLIDESEKAEKAGLKPTWKVYKSCVYEVSKEVSCCRKAPTEDRENRLRELGKDSCELCECDKIVKGEWSEGIPRTLDSVCKGKFFKSRGWMSYDDVSEKFVQNTPNKWASQLECRRPMADGLYLPTWSRERYVIRGYEPKPEYGYIWQGIDWGGCYDDKTEILTKRGWISVKNMDINDEFASLDPETHKVIYQKPNRIHSELFSGDMHEYKNKSIDLLVTPNHKMFSQRQNVRRDGSEGPWELIESKNLSATRRMTKTSDGRVDTVKNNFILPGAVINSKRKTKFIKSIEIDSEDWAAFLGLWMAEGHTSKSGYSNGVVGISHFNIKNIEEIKSKIGKYFKISDNNKGFSILDGRLYQHLSVLGKCYEKRLPEYVKTWSKDLLEIYFDWHLRGDGNRNRIYTTSKHLADDLQEIAMYVGWAADISIRPPRKSKMVDGRIIHGRYPEHIVGLLKKRNKPTLWSRNKFTKDFVKVEDFPVYCPCLPKYHTIYVRRNNKAVWCGNSASSTSAVLWIQGPLHQPIECPNTIGTKTIIPQGAYVIFKELNEAAVGATRLADKVVRQEIGYKSRFGGAWRVKGRFADKAGAQQRADWREHNPPLRTHWYLSGRYFDPTVECLQSLVADSLLYADDQNCPGTCDDFESWRQENGTEIHDSSSHNPAAARYGLKNTMFVMKRYKKDPLRQTLQPVVAARGETTYPGQIAQVGVSQPNSADYASENWRKSIGSPVSAGVNSNRNESEPWMP